MIKGFSQFITERSLAARSWARSDEDLTKKLFRFFERVFYEIRDKRHGWPEPHQFEQLTPEAAEYLLALLDSLKPFDDKFGRLGQYQHPDNNRVLTHDRDLISYLASAYFSGFGRGSKLGTSLHPVAGLSFPVPSQPIIDSIVAFAKSR